MRPNLNSTPSFLVLASKTAIFQVLGLLQVLLSLPSPSRQGVQQMISISTTSSGIEEGFFGDYLEGENHVVVRSISARSLIVLWCIQPYKAVRGRIGDLKLEMNIGYNVANLLRCDEYRQFDESIVYHRVQGFTEVFSLFSLCEDLLLSRRKVRACEVRLDQNSSRTSYPRHLEA